MSLRGDSGPNPLGAPMAAGRIWSRGFRSSPRSSPRWTLALAGELLQLADLALYEAKASFKGSYRFFRDGLRADVVDSRSLA